MQAVKKNFFQLLISRLKTLSDDYLFQVKGGGTGTERQGQRERKEVTERKKNTVRRDTQLIVRVNYSIRSIVIIIIIVVISISYSILSLSHFFHMSF